MTLNLNYLRAFVAVVEHGGFRQAAKALYVSQPAITRSIQELEKSVHHTLIERTRRAIVLTEAGHLLFAYGQRLFGLEREAVEALEQLHSLERGQLAIAASQTIGTYALPPLLGAFHSQHPGIRLSLDIRNTQEVLDSLRMKPVDLALIEGVVEGEDFEVTPWRKDHLVVIAPPHNPWGLSDRLSLKRLGQVPYIQREYGSGTREIVEQALSQHKFKPNVVMELGSNEAVIQAVMAGLGISIVSDVTIVLERAAGQLSVMTIDDHDINREFQQVTLKGRHPSPALVAFRTFLESSV
jgi:DNA-binding transcriptional LysR family regulator